MKNTYIGYGVYICIDVLTNEYQLYTIDLFGEPKNRINLTKEEVKQINKYIQANTEGE